MAAVDPIQKPTETRFDPGSSCTPSHRGRTENRRDHFLGQTFHFALQSGLRLLHIALDTFARFRNLGRSLITSLVQDLCACIHRQLTATFLGLEHSYFCFAQTLLILRGLSLGSSDISARLF